MQIQSYQGEHKIEYSIVNVSELEGALRIDAKYYDPVYLRNEELIEKRTFTFIKKLISNCDYGISIAMNTEGIGYKMLKMDDIIGILADDSNCKFADIPEKLFKKYRLMKGDILFNRVNSEEFVGRTGIYLLDGKHTFASYLIRIRAKVDCTNFYITIFLNSSYGKETLKRVSRRSVNQANINAEEFKNLKIPIPSLTFQKQIENLVLGAYKEREKAGELYKEAEDILLEELGLKNWKPKTKKIKINGKEFEEEENISIRMLSEVIKTGRMDAEYWEPKYDKFILSLTRKFNVIKLSEAFDFIRGVFISTVFYCNKKNSRPYIRIKELTNKIAINKKDVIYIKPSYKFKGNAKYLIKENDLVIAIIGDTIGKVNRIIEEFTGGFVSNNNAIVRIKDKWRNIFLPEFTQLLFQSIVVQLQVKKGKTQTGQPKINDRTINNFIIPLVDKNIQQKISQPIQKSFRARANSKKLLEIAKMGVDIFIEKDDKEGLKYISEKLKQESLL